MTENKIEKEKKTIEKIIRLYSKYHDKSEDLSPELQALLNYAKARLEHCKFGNNKPACKHCPVHCYKPDMREKMRQVMRWIMPRYLFVSPWEFFKHLF